MNDNYYCYQEGQNERQNPRGRWMTGVRKLKYVNEAVNELCQPRVGGTETLNHNAAQSVERIYGRPPIYSQPGGQASGYYQNHPTQPQGPSNPQSLPLDPALQQHIGTYKKFNYGTHQLYGKISNITAGNPEKIEFIEGK